MSSGFLKYGVTWGCDKLRVELECIKRGGVLKRKDGTVTTIPLFDLYKEAMTLLWPEDDWHRWAELFLREILQNKITSVIGPQNSGKTYMAAKFALVDFWAFPNETGILVSSTDLRGLELRVWGTIKQLFNRAMDRWPDLEGNVLESYHAVTPDMVNEGYARVLKKGIICIPCLQSGRYVGLGKYVGFKMPRVRLIADEAQLMGPTFLDAISNLAGNPDFKAVIMGNPIDPMDPLGMAAEPRDGWTNLPEPTTTTVWETKFLQGKCINFVGTDSPNFDPPVTDKVRYRYMISQRTVNEVEAFWGRDSQQFWSQVMGVMKTGLLARRVITRDLCREHHALDKAEWESTARTRIYAVDAAYSGTGGDRCVGGWIEFGNNLNGIQILKVNPPVIIPVMVSKAKSPEDQIAEYVQKDIEAYGIEPAHVFYDSTGRGTLGSAFARRFGERTPVPVEFGGRPSDRPVRFDLFVDDGGGKRLKTCREHYVDFVSELWFSVRYAIESEQIRELPEDVMKEGCSREYGTAKGNKFFVESKHDPKARERMGRSPDLFDWCFEGDTMVLTPSGQRRIDSLKPMDLVETPFGPAMIFSVSNRQIDTLTEVEFSNGSRLSGAGEHKVFTWDKGWVRMDSLSIDNEIESMYSLPVWNMLNLLFTRDTRTIFKRLVDIIRTETKLQRRGFFTDASGLSTMGLFLKSFASITRMAIGRITGSRTWSLCHSLNTLGSISISEWKTRLKRLIGLGTMLTPSLALPNGTTQTQEGSGTERTPSTSGNTSENPNRAFAQFAAHHSSRHFQQEPSTAQSTAETSRQEERPLRIKELVSCAAKSLWRTSIARRRIVPITVRQSRPPESRRVYNLTLDEHNVYYANGILVQNCVTAVEGARRFGFKIQKLGAGLVEDDSSDFFDEEESRYQQILHQKMLTHA